MKLIKTSLVAVIATIGFFSNGQDSGTDGKITFKEAKVATKAKPNTTIASAEQIGFERAEELNSKVQLTDEQLTSVRDLFIKIENRKKSISSSSEEEKNKAANELQIIENNELDKILTASQKKVLSSKSTKTASEK